MLFPDSTRPVVPSIRAVGACPSTALGVAISAVLGLILTLGASSPAQAGDILRGGSTMGAGGGGNATNSVPGANSAMAERARANASDALSRTTKALQSVQAMQKAAREAAIARPPRIFFNPQTGRTLPHVPNGLAVGGLQVAPGVPKDLLKPATSEDRTLWRGADLPAQRLTEGQTTVTVKQTKQTAVLNWKTFNIGKNTTLEFNQSAGGERRSEWIAFNKVNDPSGVPSQILGSIKADGQVYVINQNGIIFGGASQINTRTLVASALPINDNLVQQGLLNNRDAQFLFSAFPVPGGSDGTPAFNPTVTEPEFIPTAEASSYTFRDLVAVTSEKTLVRTPDLTFRAADGTKVKLVEGTDYSVSVIPAFFRATVTFTTEGLAKTNGAAVTATYTPFVAKSGNVVVQPGAMLTSPVTGDGNGGRVMLVGGNVTNAGTISTPAGQTILAAGLQVAVAAHASNDPSLRGLDVWVGAVEGPTGNATNSGLIEAFRGSASMAGRYVNQLGVIDSSTSVDLNGRIDLRASYGAVANPQFDNGGAGSGGPPFVYQNTGVVTLGAGSITRILPDYSSERTVPGTSLPQKSQINVEGLAIHLGSNALMLAPSANVTIRAGVWPYTDGDGNRTTLDSEGQPEAGLGARVSSGAQKFLFTGGQIYLDHSALIDVAGSTDVLVPLAQSILDVEFRGAELADSPLQRAGPLREVPLTVDIRRTGAYEGRFWMGTPLGDVTGLAGLIQRNVAQLTTAGGNVTLQAGGSIVLQTGAAIDVSGGFFRHEGGLVNTTRLLQDGRLVNIANALPDQIYDGVYTGKFTVSRPKYGIEETFTVPWMTGERFEPEYVEGAAGGEITMTAPSMAIDGILRGSTIQGSRQRSLPPEHSRLAIKFGAEKIVEQSPTEIFFFPTSPTPPQVIFSDTALQPSAERFRLIDDEPAPLAADRVALVTLSPQLLSEQGFGHLSIENTDGDVTIPAGVNLVAPPLGSVSLTGANVAVRGEVSAPGGGLEFVAYNISPAFAAEFSQSTPVQAPAPNVGRGLFSLASGSTLSTAGLVVDDRPSASAALRDPLVIDGGSISIRAYSANLQQGSTIDVSGGAVVGGRGAVTYGDGGLISIRTGKDPEFGAVLGGELVLKSTLEGYSGEKGGALTVQATLIQIGGTARFPNTLLLQPGFFRQGGFTSYTLEGIGASSDEPIGLDEPATYAPAITIASGTRIEPVAESLLALTNQVGSQEVRLSRTLQPVGQRSPTSISFLAQGADDFLTLEDLEARGDLLMGRGAQIVTDPGASVSFKGDTVSILGSVTAPGGTISIAGASKFRLVGTAALSATFARPTVYLGPESRLSTAGTSVLEPDEFERRLGTLLPGGRITVAGNIVADAGAMLDVSGASTVFDLNPAELGQVEMPIVSLDSGLTASVWRFRSVPTRLDSDGGLIDLKGSEMLYSDATLRGAAGGPTAIGGTLSIFSGRFYTAEASRTSADINLIVTQDGSQIPAPFEKRGVGLRVGEETGIGRFAIHRFSEGGFHSLDLGATFIDTASPVPFGGNIEFRGPVSIFAPGFLRVAGGGIIQADAPVSLVGSYVAIGQPFRAPLTPSGSAIPPFQQTPPTERLDVAPTAGPGKLTVQGDFIDTGNLSLQNIGNASLIADGGDIRGNGTLSLAGDLHLRASQVYPTTVGDFTIVAYDRKILVASSAPGNAKVTLASADLPYGFKVGSSLLGSTVRAIDGTTVFLASSANATITTPTELPFAFGSVTVSASGRSSAPLSAGGKLSIFASAIVQDGTVRAPLGSITLGWDGTDFDPADSDLDQPFDAIAGAKLSIPITRQLTLRSGSLTSVAAIDSHSETEMLIPYGLSPEGLSWIDPRGVNVTANGLSEKRVSLAGENVSTQKGSQIDIRGGGDLYAFRWVPGPGGNADILGTANEAWSAGEEYQPGDLVSFGGKTWSARVRHSAEAPSISPFWTQIAESFAVIPGFASDAAPFTRFAPAVNNVSLLGGDPGYVSSTLKIGDKIYLEATPGLAAGDYTLLPRRYALLPGAFLVTPTHNDTIGSITLLDGGTLVSGYQTNGFSQPGQRSPVLSQFEVASFDVTRSRAEYDDYIGSEFIAAAAARLDIDEPQRLPIDSGYLSFHGNSGLRPEGSVMTGYPAGGRGASIDLSSFADIHVVGGSGSAPAGSKVILNTSTLESWGAESLFIGGLRRDGATGTIAEVRAKDVVLNNPKDLFAAPEITLAANNDLTLSPGSAVAQTGNLSSPAATLLPTGSVRLATTGESITVAIGGAAISFPSGTPGDNRITSTVAGTITLANGNTVPLAVDEPVSLAADSTITLDGAGSIAYASGSSGPIPITVGDGALLRVTSDRSAKVVRSGLVSSTSPNLTLGAGARVAGSNVILDSTYGTSLDPSASFNAQALSLGSGQISILLEPTTDLVGSVVDPHLILSGQILKDVQVVSALTLRSYRTIDVYGSGTFGDSLGSLSLLAGGIRGFGQSAGLATFRAGSVLFDNPSDVAALPAPAAASGTLKFEAGLVRLGSNAFSITGHENIVLEASTGVVGQGAGMFTTTGNLTITTPFITGAGGSTHSVTAAGDLVLDQAAGGLGSGVGLGASFTFSGSSVVANTSVVLPSGQITLRSTGDAATDGVTVGGTLDVSGTQQQFYDLIRFSSAGTVTLTSKSGDVRLEDGSKVSVAAASAGGSAGTVTVNAARGAFASTGATLLGAAAIGHTTGSFVIDVGALTSFAGLSSALNTGGFFEQRNLRVRTGDIVIADVAGQANVARDFTVSTDQGTITVQGTIDASWRRGLSDAEVAKIREEDRTGGKISLIAGGNLILDNGAVLTASAEVFSNAGQGGAIRLEAGAAVNGIANPAAILDIRAGSKIDLRVEKYVAGDYTTPGSSAFGGKFTGTLHLRAPRTGEGAGNGIAISAIGGEIVGASSILAEGYKIYTVSGADGTITGALQTQIRTEGQAFMGSAGETVENYTTMLGSMLASQPSEVKSVFVLAPGAEIVNLNGNVTLGTASSTSTSDWDLSTFRFGPHSAPGVLTIRAAEDLVFNNALSDGFTPVTATAATGNSTMWLAPLMDLNPALPINTQSWSFRLTAGADLSAADFAKVQPLEEQAPGKGSVLVGKAFTLPTTGSLSTTTSAVIGASGRGFQVIRTGAGNIDIAAGRDVRLQNQFSTIYTAGVRLPTSSTTTMSIFTPGDFVIPNITPTSSPPNGNLGAIQQTYRPQWSMGGGHLTISAGANIDHGLTTVSGRVIADATAQLPSNWLYRRGLVDPATGLFANGRVVDTGSGVNSVTDLAASTAWWIDFSNFFQGVGTLGGGDVTLLAGQDVVNVDAVAPTNARMPGRVQNADETFTNLAPDATKLVEFGGGDIFVRSGGNIDGGIYYVERGSGTLVAGQSIKTNESRSPATVGNTSSSHTWLPTTLFVGKGSFDVSARGDVLLGPVVNPFTLPQGLNNRYWYKSYFDTYSPESSVTTASFGGSVTHRLWASADGQDAAEPILTLWMRQKDLIAQGSLANSQPWLRLGEGSIQTINAFQTAVTVMPPTLRSTAFAGDVNIVGRINLFPASLGTLELAASGGIVGLQPAGTKGLLTNWTAAGINVSDADPVAFNGIASPLGFQNLVGNQPLDLIGSNILFYAPLATFNASFAETGSFSGIAASFEVQQALHAPGLHAMDAQPVRLYAVGGDVTGVTLFSPKSASIVAANDITDVSFYIQNNAASDVSLVSAGRDVIPFNENGALRSFASDNVRNQVGDTAQPTVSGGATSALPGDIQINGLGVLEILAGRNLDLGTGANLADGTGVGLTSVGNSRNPFLPFTGADIIALAGVSGVGGAGPAFGLAASTLDFEAFNQLYLPDGVVLSSNYLTKLETEVEFEELTEEQQAVVGLETFFGLLRDSGRSASADGDYSVGFAAIQTLFGAETSEGEILTRARDIRTTSGGAVSILAPGGGVTMASDIFGNPLTPPGIVTEFGGPVSVFTEGSVDIGQARIFTLRGGDIVMWASTGNIAAGNAPRTVATAPPTRVVIDATSANVQTDLGGLATGGGIGVLASVEGVLPGDVDLIAPGGIVDAGDAGIRVTGSLNIAATAVLNAGNIQVAGASTGVPATAPPAAPVLAPTAPPPPAPNTTPVQEELEKRREQAQEEEDRPSIIIVEVLGYGGGEG